MKTIEEHYKEWCGEFCTTNSCHPVHDSTETIDFAQYYYQEANHSFRPALKLAAKLAIAARSVITSNSKNLSKRIEETETALDAYDNEIISLSQSKLKNEKLPHNTDSLPDEFGRNKNLVMNLLLQLKQDFNEMLILQGKICTYTERWRFVFNQDDKRNYNQEMADELTAKIKILQERLNELKSKWGI